MDFPEPVGALIIVFLDFWSSILINVLNTVSFWYFLNVKSLPSHFALHSSICSSISLGSIIKQLYLL